MDYGIDHELVLLSVQTKKIVLTKRFSEKEKQMLKQAEEKLNDQLSKGNFTVYKNYLSANSRFNLNGFLPAVNKNKQQQLIDSIPQGFEFSSEGNDFSSSNDLAFTYGSLKKGKTISNYMHLWRREKKGWKIAAEILRFD
ncbi:MAG: hypothetical protein C4308_03640 [Chitinophagaceae bacterium]